eukprot:TRINITY_DN27035_c0_g1_i1.p1 TRINITY_DN27035_c0_g1~~TRINITY_DN27035_c0_g1_i1.p1  ORF type:complete len:635 (+),score=142.91 TRINITY_DN27035_c0_g1_i1:98-2002(+)
MGDEIKTMGLGCAGATCLSLLIFLIVLFASIQNVTDQEQILFIEATKRRVRNGPFTDIVWPHQKHEKRKAVRIAQQEYAIVKQEREQKLRHVEGPELLFLGAYDKLESVEKKIALQKREYIRLVDKLSGAERVVAGPAILVPKASEVWPNGVETCIVVGATNAVITVDTTTGMKRLVTKKGHFVPAPYEEIIKEQQAILLEPTDYAVVKDLLTGITRNEVGPQQLQQGPYEMILNDTKRKKLVLEKDEYVRLLNQKTGSERVLRGPAMLVPEPWEVYPDGIQEAAKINSQTGVLVLDRSTGQQRLETTRGVFIPQPYESVLAIQQKQVVLPNEAAVTRDIYSNLTLRTSANGSTSFFIEPYTEIVKMQWSVYDTPNPVEPVPKQEVSMIDLRAQKMFFSNEVRTSDNVKLILEGTIFWQVKDVLTMISKTADPSGDVAQRAKSGLIAAVSRSTFDAFMKGFSNITNQAFSEQASDTFYRDRGVELQSLELTRFDCVDQETRDVLQEIIQESTNRINRLEQARSENDVNEAKLRADIQLEQKKTDLIKTQVSNDRLQASLAGQAEGAALVENAIAFLDGLNESVPGVEDRTELYRLHQTMDGRNVDTKNLASGQAKLFITPKNMNLKLQMGSSEL